MNQSEFGAQSEEIYCDLIPEWKINCEKEPHMV